MLVVYFISALLVLILLGTPIFAAMGMASLLHYLDLGRDSAAIVLMQRLFSGVSSFTLLAVPMFLLAGEIMGRGGLTNRIISLAKACVGHFRGGLAQVNILSSVFFGGISGSAHADVAAIGSVLIPSMKREGYPPGFAGALTAVSGTLSPMIPPSIVLIIYGSTFGVSIGALFAAGLSIAAVLATTYMVLTWFLVRNNPDIPHHPRVTRQEFLQTLKEALPALGLPVVILGGIFLGIFTATEAAGVAVTYSLLITLFYYRSIRFVELPKILYKTGLTTAAIVILVGVAVSFSHVIVDRNVPEVISGVILELTGSHLAIIFLLLMVMIVAGMFVDRTANILLFGGILIPIFTQEIGFSPVHTAMIIVMALGIGHMTPPVGGTLLTTSLVGRMSIVEITRYVWPYIILEIAVTLLVVFVAPLSEFLPRLLGFGGL